jgi:hypothetical protein
VAAMIARWPEYIRLALAAVTAGISAYSVVMQNQKLAVDSSDLHVLWNRRLWDDMYSEDALGNLDARAAGRRAIEGRDLFSKPQGPDGEWEAHVVAQYTGTLKAA